MCCFYESSASTSFSSSKSPWSDYQNDNQVTQERPCFSRWRARPRVEVVGGRHLSRLSLAASAVDGSPSRRLLAVLTVLTARGQLKFSPLCWRLDCRVRLLRRLPELNFSSLPELVSILIWKVFCSTADPHFLEAAGRYFDDVCQVSDDLELIVNVCFSFSNRPSGQSDGLQVKQVSGLEVGSTALLVSWSVDGEVERELLKLKWEAAAFGCEEAVLWRTGEKC